MSNLLKSSCNWMTLLLVLHWIAHSTAQTSIQPSHTVTATHSTPVTAVSPSPSPSDEGDGEDRGSDSNEKVLLPLIAVLFGGLCVMLLFLAGARFVLYRYRNVRSKRHAMTLNESDITEQPVARLAESNGNCRSNVRSWNPYVDALLINPTYYNLKPLERKANTPTAADTFRPYHSLDPLSMDYTNLYVKVDCSKKEKPVLAEPMRNHHGIEVSETVTPKVCTRPRTSSV